MPSAIEPVDRSASARPEAERQLAAAAERHREVVASMQELGRSEAGQHVAVKAVGRAVQLVALALTHAAETGVPVERLVELTDWDPRLVNGALARGPEPSLVAQFGAAGAGRRRRRAGRGRHRGDRAPAGADAAHPRRHRRRRVVAGPRRSRRPARAPGQRMARLAPNAGTTAVNGTEQRRAPRLTSCDQTAMRSRRARELRHRPCGRRAWPPGVRAARARRAG